MGIMCYIIFFIIYRFFNNWLKSLKFCWRVGMIVHTKLYGFEVGTSKRDFKDNDGNWYRLTLINKEDKE